MIWAWMKPLASSALRIAPMRPSIISDGAWMSAPASVWDDRLLDQGLERLVVLDIAIAHNAVMAVAVERVERHVGEHADVGHCLLHCGGGPADEIAGIVGLASVRRLRPGIGLGEDGDGRNAEIARLLGSLDEQIDCQSIDTRHGLYWRALVLALLHEHRPNQVVDRELVLGDQTARPVLAAVAAQPRGRVAAQG